MLSKENIKMGEHSTLWIIGDSVPLTHVISHMQCRVALKSLALQL